LARDLLDNPVLQAEIAKEINHAAESIVRRTSCDAEVAFFRGKISGLENLEKRLKTLKAEHYQFMRVEIRGHIPVVLS
jgi:hypothetical protein